MGQIIGIDTSLIKNIAGINASEITKIGEIETEYIDRKGNPVKLFTGAGVRSTNLPYTFTPGNSVASATFEKSSDVEEPSNNKVLGASRTDDTLNIIPTVKLNNFKNKLYKLPKTNSSQVFTISQWFKINDFPRHTNNDTGYTIRKKATAISRYDFKSPGDSNKLSAGFIEFGAIGPYYRKANGSKPYKGIFVPFSLGVFIYNGKYPISLYTDYAYQLGTWYMMSLNIEGDLTNSTTNNPCKLELYINGELVSTAVYNGRLWSQKQLSKGGRTNRKKVIATSPGFLNFYDSLLPNQPTHNIVFKKFLNLFEMNYVSFSPIVRFGDVGYNDGYHEAGGDGRFPFTNSRIDFGTLTISQDNAFPELYSSTSADYQNSAPPSSGVFIINMSGDVPEMGCSSPLLGSVDAYYNFENHLYYSDPGFNEFFVGNDWIYKDLNNNWIVQIGNGDNKIISSCG